MVLGNTRSRLERSVNVIGAKRGSPILISGKEMSANESSHNSIAVTGGGSPSPQMEKGEGGRERNISFPICLRADVYLCVSFPFFSLSLIDSLPVVEGRNGFWTLESGCVVCAVGC